MVEVSPHDNSDRTTPIGLASFSKEFFQAALVVDRDMGSRNPIFKTSTVPANFLIAQSIELILKSFLLFNGVTLSELRSKRYGHDLVVLMNKANEYGLEQIVTFSVVELNEIRHLNKQYASKQLQYIVTGAKIFPTFEPLETATKKLILAVNNKVR